MSLESSLREAAANVIPFNLFRFVTSLLGSFDTTGSVYLQSLLPVPCEPNRLTLNKLESESESES